MPADRRKQAERRGRRGEALAALFLQLKLYRILGRRVKTRAGEIDLVVKSPTGILCFVEVKVRPEAVLAEEAVGVRQRARIARAAELYLAGRKRPKGVRFDVVTVVPGRLPRHLIDAVRPDGL